MKIKNLKKNKKILKLNLIKFKYNKTIELNSNISTNNITLIKLKKIIKIIYTFNKKNKNILFIDAPLNFQTAFLKTIKQTNYSFNNSNNFYNFKSILKKLPNNKKKPDLIIMFENKNSKTVLPPHLLAKVPIIFLNSKNYNKTICNYSYNILQNTTLHNNLFLNLLNSTFKR